MKNELHARHPVILTTVLMILVVCAAPKAAPQSQGIVFEDQEKQVAFRPPDKWVCEKDSNREVLIFKGPLASGKQSSLVVRTLRDGRPYEEALSHYLSRYLEVEIEEIGTAIETFDAGSSAFIDYAATWVRKIKSRSVRILVAMARDETFLFVLTFTFADSIFDRILPSIESCLSSVEPLISNSAITNEKLGISSVISTPHPPESWWRRCCRRR